jgi:hypothetical protein
MRKAATLVAFEDFDWIFQKEKENKLGARPTPPTPLGDATTSIGTTKFQHLYIAMSSLSRVMLETYTRQHVGGIE